MMAKCLLNSKLWRLTVVPKGFFSVTPQTLNLITYGRLNSHTLTEGETSLEEMEIKAMQIIRNFTEEDRKHLKRLEDEYWHVRTEGNRAVPQQMSNMNWLALMSIKHGSEKQRMKMYGKWALIERKKQKKENVKTMTHETQAKAEGLEDLYGLNANPYNMRGKTLADMKKAKQIKGMQALMFGSPLVFDFTSVGSPLPNWQFVLNIVRMCVDINMDHQEPFHLHVTGILDKKSLPQYQSLKGVTVYQKDILEIFPAERLVYVTPYTENMLQCNSDDIFVLGIPYKRMPDVTASRHVFRIRELGVRSGCLPVHHYIRQCMKRERIPLCYIVRTLLDYSFTKDWDKALKNLNQGLNKNEKFIYSKLSKNRSSTILNN